MREAKAGERIIVAVPKRSTEACAGYMMALVDDEFVDPKQGAVGTLFIQVEEAITRWLCENEGARKLIESSYSGCFNFGDLVDHLGGGYDDRGREELKETDLEKYFMAVGIKGMEVEAFIATDPDNTLWAYDDPLFDEDTVEETRRRRRRVGG